MKHVNVLIFVTFLILVSSTLRITAENTGTDDQNPVQHEKKDKIVRAESWFKKGGAHFKKKEYIKTVECLYKALELNPSEIKYIITLAKVYVTAEKFAEAKDCLNETLRKFPDNEKQKKLQIELADVHYYWGRNFEKNTNHLSAIEHYESAFAIVKIYQPQKCPIVLENIGNLYHKHNSPQKALEYFEKALDFSRSVGDLLGEGIILNRIGKVNADIGNPQKALECYEKSLPIMKEVGGRDRNRKAKLFNSLGILCSRLGRKEEALANYHEALHIFQELGNQDEESSVFSNIGLLYSEIGQYKKALEYLENSLSLKQKNGDRSTKAAALNNIAKVYSHLNKYQEALKYYEEALQIAISLDDKKHQATTLNNIGAVYFYLRQKQLALEYYKKAIKIRQDIGDRGGEASTLQDIGALYFDSGEKKKALDHYKKSLPILQKTGQRATEAIVLNNIGAVYAGFGKIEKALGYHLKALEIQRKIGDRNAESVTLENIGSSYTSLGKHREAHKYLKEGLKIASSINDLSRIALIMKRFMNLKEKTGELRFAAFLGKLSVNILQKIRLNIAGLNLNIQESYFEQKKYIYRFLTDILIGVGRLSEAQQVLEILKEEELYDFTSGIRSPGINLSTPLDFIEFERQWYDKYNTVMEKLTKVSNEHQVLKIKINRDRAEEEQFQRLDLQLKTQVKTYKDFMRQISKVFNEREKGIKKGKITPGILPIKTAELQEKLGYLDKVDEGKHAVLQYMVFRNRVTVILTLASGQVVKQSKIDEEKLSRMIMTYRYFMMQAGRGTIPTDRAMEVENKRYKKIKGLENRFYKLIFKKADKVLQENEITDLVISLDGILRYLPIATLWDGKDYLLQRYRISIVTPSSLKNIKAPPIKEKKILGLGAGQGGEGFKPLPNVSSEIRSIVKDEEKGYHGVIEGKAFIDNDFTEAVMFNQLKNNHYPLVHIASHFKFSPGNENRNLLLLGDGSTISLNDIRAEGKLFDKVKLLVLSACQTGVGGNGEEIDGFGELAQQSGAEAVIASLWPVADKSTRDLMTIFYEKIDKGEVKSKIEALRQAQLELSGLEDLLRENDPGKVFRKNRRRLFEKTSRSVKARKEIKYSHPYYWAPFILIGNWR